MLSADDMSWSWSYISTFGPNAARFPMVILSFATAIQPLLKKHPSPISSVPPSAHKITLRLVCICFFNKIFPLSFTDIFVVIEKSCINAE